MNHNDDRAVSAVSDPIAEAIAASLEQYFQDLDGEAPCAVYDMVLGRVEKPLLTLVLARVDGNQTRAAEVLGINRNTLRKKLQTYDLL
ncbi:helix-turn-helix domain-containing protein [Chitinolyticbacter meiyuanensis]|uniref:helix-turn-helix domain-containing protein n=1 Tax=Chitinolyticbacter meiyuanensis TaxID=682798 RepID=UPI0011E5E987|nr:helix-turn-helix domain-containing protein [Chitinolyticbacter meiyuanensis]